MEKSKTRKSSPQTQKDKKKTKKEKPSRSAEHIQPGMNELVERTPPHEIFNINKNFDIEYVYI